MAPAAGATPGTGTTPASRPVFEVEGLHVDYTTEHGVLHAVRDVSLAIHEHESFGLVGESGSGKSTLAMGAIRYLAANGTVTDGSVRLSGVELLGLPAKKLRELWGSAIGVVYQSPLSALNPSIVIGRQLAEVARQHLGMDAGAAKARVAEMLTKVAMPDPEAVMRRYPHQLSGGMLQRCVIAMALMTNPSLLIMDEPTTALDVTTQAVVLDLVAELKREFDSAILYITHDLGVITKICDRVGVMYAGEFMEQAALRELFMRPLHPYTLDLLGCVPRFDPTPEKRSLVTIPGAIPRVDELPPGCIFAPRCEFVEEACTAGRPPLGEVAPGHLSACRRWSVVPPPREHLREATESVRASGAAFGDGGVLVETSGAEVHFQAPKGVIRAVDGVDLQVRVGQTLGVVGESGSGKTTVARAIIGLTPATGGDILLRGAALPRTTGKRPRSTLREIQMVFQNPDASLNPQRTAGDAVARPLQLLGNVPREQLAQRVRELFRAVNLPEDFIRRLPHELSGGEKQRLAIARALAAGPDLMICDEPISSLDVSVQASLMNLLAELQAAQGVAYLFISHDLAAVRHMADWIAVVYLGRIWEIGPAHEVFSPPRHPYTEALLSALPIPDPDAEQEHIRLQGDVPSAIHIPPGCRFHTRCPRRIGEICDTQEPPWQSDEHEHRICCHIPMAELRAMQEAGEQLPNSGDPPGAE